MSNHSSITPLTISKRDVAPLWWSWCCNQHSCSGPPDLNFWCWTPNKLELCQKLSELLLGLNFSLMLATFYYLVFLKKGEFRGSRFAWVPRKRSFYKQLMRILTHCVLERNDYSTRVFGLKLKRDDDLFCSLLFYGFKEKLAFREKRKSKQFPAYGSYAVGNIIQQLQLWIYVHFLTLPI